MVETKGTNMKSILIGIAISLIGLGVVGCEDCTETEPQDTKEMTVEVSQSSDAWFTNGVTYGSGGSGYSPE